MALQSLVRSFPSLLRLYLAKSTGWQVEAAFRDEVIAEWCCSKLLRFAGDEERRGTCLRERKTVLVKEAIPRRRKVLAAGHFCLLPPVLPCGRRRQLITARLSTHQRTVWPRSIVSTADDFLLPVEFEAQGPVSPEEKRQGDMKRGKGERETKGPLRLPLKCSMLAWFCNLRTGRKLASSNPSLPARLDFRRRWPAYLLSRA